MGGILMVGVSVVSRDPIPLAPALSLSVCSRVTRSLWNCHFRLGLDFLFTRRLVTRRKISNIMAMAWGKKGVWSTCSSSETHFNITERGATGPCLGTMRAGEFQ